MESIGERIRSRRKALRLTQKAVGEAVGVTASAVSQWESGDAEPDDGNLDRLAEILESPRQWIEFGPGGRPKINADGLSSAPPMLYQPDSIVPIAAPKGRIPVMKVMPVNVIGEIQAGVFKPAVEWPKGKRYEVHVPIQAPFNKAELFALKIVGPSMDQVFPDGTVVICAKIMDLGPMFELQSGYYVVVLRKDQSEDVEATVKQFMWDENGAGWLWPRSNHQDFQKPWRVEDLATSDDNDDIFVWALVVADTRMRV